MTKLKVLPPQRMLPGRKGPVDVSKLSQLKSVVFDSPLAALEQLLIFDARMLDKDTQRELLRILPQLVHVRRAWKAHFLENGCVGCRVGEKPDPTYKIAANLRRAGMSWEQVFDALTLDAELTSRDRELIRTGVSNRLKALAKRGGGPKREAQKESAWYGAGGFCNTCQNRILSRMLKRYRKSMEGRNPSEEIAKFKDALCLKYNAAQRLLNGKD